MDSGQATKQEQEYLLRYNIDLEDAQKIANDLGKNQKLVFIWQTLMLGQMLLSFSN